MKRVSVAFVLLLLPLFATRPAFPSDFYQWTDENGVTHIADSLDQVPAKYRSQVRTAQSAPGTTPKEVSSPPRGPSSAADGDSSAASSARVEVPYEVGTGSGRRVIIPVTFNGTRTAPMALDTGATGMVISFELAEQLGLFSNDQGKLVVHAAGLGGVVPVIRTIVEVVSVGDARDVFIPTMVTHSLSTEFQGLIGMDFLSNYSVSLDSKRHMLVLQANPPDRNARGGHDEDWWRKIFGEFHSSQAVWREYAAQASHLGTADRALADYQAHESERLMQRLERYASDNAVPQEWR